jgi:hypothetical protein
MKSKPVAQILGWTLAVGAVSFAAGFFGPIFFSTSNLGPLFGIFVTGPIGTLAGALIGALRVAKGSARLSIACIALVWVMALLYTLFVLGLATQGAIPPIILQLLIIASSIFLFLRSDAPDQPPDGLGRYGPIAIAALVIILVMTLFPPVIRPWWIPSGEQAGTAELLPPFAFILDGRFDAGRHFPRFAVSRGALAWEWLITAVVAVGLCLLMRPPRRRPVN